MAIYSISFSPTGGTQKVMDCLAGAWGGVVPIDLCDPHADFGRHRFSADDLCLIGVPSFEGRVPPLALEHLRAMEASQTPCVLVVVFGNRDFNDTLLELKNTVCEQGFVPFGAVSAVARHSMLPAVAAGRPDARDQEELRGFSARLKEAPKTSEVEVPGNEPYIVIPASPSYPLFSEQLCSGCGICAAECPAQAIDAADLGHIDTNRCARCLHCVAVCPAQARVVDPKRQQHVYANMAQLFEGRKPNTLYL